MIGIDAIAVVAGAAAADTIAMADNDGMAMCSWLSNSMDLCRYSCYFEMVSNTFAGIASDSC